MDLKSLIQAQLGLYGSVAAILGPSPWMLFFLACIMAPFWEEIVFRYFPLRLIQTLERPGINLVLPAVMFTSVIFGLAHGSVFNILFQGASGMLLAWVFLKNNSYWSAVILHSLWNTMLLFGFPTLFNMMKF
jgi:membrane protease YdiL (CAAX protease family)